MPLIKKGFGPSERCTNSYYGFYLFDNETTIEDIISALDWGNNKSVRGDTFKIQLEKDAPRGIAFWRIIKPREVITGTCLIAKGKGRGMDAIKRIKFANKP